MRRKGKKCDRRFFRQHLQPVPGGDRYSAQLSSRVKCQKQDDQRHIAVTHDQISCLDRLPSFPALDPEQSIKFVLRQPLWVKSASSVDQDDPVSPPKGGMKNPIKQQGTTRSYGMRGNDFRNRGPRNSNRIQGIVTRGIKPIFWKWIRTKALRQELTKLKNLVGSRRHIPNVLFIRIIFKRNCSFFSAECRR